MHASTMISVPCCFCLGFLSVIVLSLSIITFSEQRHKEKYYIENKCLVEEVEIVEEICGYGDRKHIRTCYETLWTVKYKQPPAEMLNQVEKTVYISGRHTEEYSIAMNEKQKYRVGSNYTCYHDSRLDKYEAQWTQPSSTSELKVLIVGICLTIATVILCIFIVTRHVSYKRKYQTVPSNVLAVSKQNVNK